MKVIGIIPARMASQRLPQKPLTPLLNKPLIQWVLEGVQSSQKIEEFYVATDHEEIVSCVEAAGGKAIMTPSDLPSGTDRVWAAVKEMDVDWVVNIQGDEPLITGEILDEILGALTGDPEFEMGTLSVPMSLEGLNDPSVVKVVTNKNGEAIYFSRLPIPYSRIDASHQLSLCAHHIGLYIYRKDFLQKFCEEPPCDLEKAESLEQLRALYMGAKIRVVHGSYELHGVDTPEDVKMMEKKLKKMER